MRKRVTFQSINTPYAAAQAATTHFQEVGLNPTTFKTFCLNCSEAGIKVRVNKRSNNHLIIQLVS